MKSGKKFVALLLALLLMLTLCACGGKKNELLGTWSGSIDMAPSLIDTIDSSLAVEKSGYDIPSYGDYLDSLPLRMTLELKEDGTYLQQADAASIQEIKDKMFDSTVKYYYDVLPVIIDTEVKKAGMDVDVSTVEKLEEYLGMDFDEIIEQILGTDMESYVQSILAEEDFDELFEKEEGKYKVEDGKLFLSAGLEYNVDPKSYHPYSLKDGVLTLEANTIEVDDTERMLYPISLRLVK